jgi:hypothetical protein
MRVTAARSGERQVDSSAGRRARAAWEGVAQGSGKRGRVGRQAGDAVVRLRLDAVQGVPLLLYAEARRDATLSTLSMYT